MLLLSLLAALPALAQKPDTTLIRYTGQLLGQYTSGGVSRTLFATAHSVTLLRGLHFGAPVAGSFTFGKQEPLNMAAGNNSLGESGTSDQMMEKYGLNEQAIVAAVEKVMARRK